MTDHVCSRHPESCPSCGHKDSRDGFEGWESRTKVWEGTVNSVFFVRCPKCEAPHPDQSNHDEVDCDACQDETIEEDRRYLERMRDAA